MGWTSTHREPGISNVDFFADLLGERHRILAHHTDGRSAFYAAVENIATGEVWALVVMTQWTRDHLNFTYKDMDDSCGPTIAAAPAKILDRLSPTDHKYAVEWRARCRQRLERRAAAAAALVDGATVQLAKPLKFSDGSTRDTFTYRRRGHLSGLYDGHTRYRIPGWRDMDLVITAPATVPGESA
jgi:hypothetical protein